MKMLMIKIHNPKEELPTRDKKGLFKIINDYGKFIWVYGEVSYEGDEIRDPFNYTIAPIKNCVGYVYMEDVKREDEKAEL